jgi:hypothetical protein
MRKIVPIAAAAACVLAVAGCGASGAPTVTVSSGTSTATRSTVSGSPTAAASASTMPRGPEYKLLSKSTLSGALLTLNDMPNGFADTTTQGDQVDDAGTFCHYKRPYPNKAFVTRVFTKGGGFDAKLISPTIRQYAGPAQAKASMAKLLATLKTCKKFTSDGESLKVAQVKADPVGETSVAVRLEGSNFTIIQGYSLVGPSMVTVGTGGSTSVDSDVVGPLLKEQVERYTRAAQK